MVVQAQQPRQFRCSGAGGRGGSGKGEKRGGGGGKFQFIGLMRVWSELFGSQVRSPPERNPNDPAL